MRHFSHSIDYVDIGLRIKNLRRKQALSQEQLAENTGLSISHISHIENASTKLSLPSLVIIANYFQVSIDYLLCGSLSSVRNIYLTQIDELLSSCNDADLHIILETVGTLTDSLHKNHNKRRHNF